MAAPLGGGEAMGRVEIPPPPPAPRRSSWLATVLPRSCSAPSSSGVVLISYVVLAPRRRFLLRPPHEVLETGFLDQDNLAEILDGLTGARGRAIGLTISIVLGVAIVILMSQTIIIERATFPFLVMLQAIPILAIVPLIVFCFGTGEGSRVIVCVIISLFPIIVNTLFGLQSADRAMHDLFTLQHASRTTRMRKLMLPAALPAMFAGLRIAAGLSVIGAIVGPLLRPGQAGARPAAQALRQSARRRATSRHGDRVLALGVAVFLFFGWVQKRAIGRWYEPGGAV